MIELVECFRCEDHFRASIMSGVTSGGHYEQKIYVKHHEYLCPDCLDTVENDRHVKKKSKRSVGVKRSKRSKR